MLKEISLRILVQKPAQGTMYGLQKGKVPGYEIVQPQLGNGQDLTFDFVILLKQANGLVPSPGGPFVQGTSSNRFVYIAIGSYAGQTGAPWSGRMKIPLSDADFQNIISDGGEYRLSCEVHGSSENGKPVFATVKPFGGWIMSKLPD